MPRKIKVLFYLFVGLIACESRAEVIRYTTWNLQWLATPQHGKLISPNRGESDIRLLRKYFIKTSADIMAFQEVNDHEKHPASVYQFFHFKNPFEFKLNLFKNIFLTPFKLPAVCQPKYCAKQQSLT